MKRTQLRVVAMTLVLWALGASASLWSGAWWALVAAYGAAWILLQRTDFGVRTRASLVLFSLLPLVVLWGHRDDFAEGELLSGLPEHLGDRLRLEGSPTIAPGVVFGDHPQQFFVHAPGHARVSARFSFGAPLEGVSLGEGIFRVDYDPREHGAPTREGESTVHIRTDEVWTTRSIEVVVPRPHPRWFCRAPSGDLAATVSEETDALLLVDPKGHVQTLPVGDGPTDCAFLDDGRILVSHRYGPTLWLVDARSRRVLRRLPWPRAHRLATSPSRGLFAVAERDAVAVVDARSLELLARTPLPADWLVFSDERTLVASSRRPAALHRLSASQQWSVTDTLPLGRPAVTMERVPEGVVVATTDYVPSGEPHLGNHFVQDQLLTIDTRAWAVVDRRLTAERSARQGTAGNVDRGISPMGFEARAGVLSVVFAGSDELWRMREGLAERIPLDALPAPHDVVTFDHGAFAVSSPSRGVIGTRLQEGEWRLVMLGEGEEDALTRGERAFYEGTRAGIACQSCHLHGDTDFVLRNIGGARLAPTLGVGGIAGTSPYLRDGSYPRIRDLDHLAETLFRGYLRPDSRRGEDIEAYVRALPRRRPAPREDLARVRRGARVFTAAGCSSCHTPPAFTHLGQIPLGALFPGLPERAADEVLDTPSLLSVSTHGPYLSDGRASTLRSVLVDHNPADRHGHTQGLEQDEVDDLVYFLEAL